MASIRRCFPIIFSTSWRTAASSVTSTVCPSSRGSLVPAALFKASNSSCFRYVTTTFAPSSRNARVTACPKPPVPPATRATFPSNLALIGIPLSLMLLAPQPFGHQKSIVIRIPRSAVEFECGVVSSINLKMDGIRTHLQRFLFNKSNGPPAVPALPVRRVNIQLVDKRIVAVKFKAESHCQYDVPYRFVRLVLRPGRSSRFDGLRRSRRHCRHESIRRKG